MPPKEKEEHLPTKINKWDGSAAKNAIDDAIKEVLIKKFNFTENHGLMDGRLAICSIAVGIALFALLWDYLHPFPESRPALIVCVTSYFIMMGILTLYTTYVEKGIFFVAIQKEGNKKIVWEASSLIKKYDDKYLLAISYKDSKKGSRREATTNKSIANYIDVNGNVVNEIVETEITKLHNSLLSEKKEK